MLQRLKNFVRNYEFALAAWVVIFLLIVGGLQLGLDKHVIGAVVILVGFLGQAFTALIAWIAFVPLVGPVLAKILALPFIWLINGIGYLASLIAIKRGYSKDVINYQLIAFSLLVGITIGYVLGKII